MTLRSFQARRILTPSEVSLGLRFATVNRFVATADQMEAPLLS